MREYCGEGRTNTKNKREEAKRHVPLPPTSYNDLVKQRVQTMRDQREHRKKSLFSKAISVFPS
jgi:hypothetical protein